MMSLCDYSYKYHFYLSASFASFYISLIRGYFRILPAESILTFILSIITFLYYFFVLLWLIARRRLGSFIVPLASRLSTRAPCFAR